MRAEAVVVGAGPAGLLAAREIASKGFGVRVFEEHQAVGEPSHCAGLISAEGLSRLGVEPSEDFVQQEILGGRVYSPGGECVEFRCRRTRAFAVDRTAFDLCLADSARGEGAEIETGSRVEELLLTDGGVGGVKGRGWETRSCLVVDAEGASAGLLKGSGLLPHPQEALAGVNVEVGGVELEPQMVEVWLSGEIAPGLFAWVIPTGEGAARCGLACRGGGAVERLDRFLGRRFGTVEASKPRGGLVLTGGPISRTYSGGLLVAGDAAGQTKPTTGGGVVMGGLCAVEAGKTAVEALEAGDTSARFLERYQRAWSSSLGGEFRSMLLSRRLLDRLPDERIDRAFASFKGEGLEGELERLVEEGDMDLQGGVIRAALRDRRLFGIALKAAGRLALGELRALVNL